MRWVNILIFIFCLPTLADSIGGYSRRTLACTAGNSPTKAPFEERSIPLFKDGSTAGQLFDEDGIQNLPNPLLASWGKLGRDYIHMLSDITSSGEGDVDAFVEIAPDACCIIFS
jgi:exonuclease V gamma subunit